MMEIEQLEIRDYIGKCAPFDRLDGETLNTIVKRLEITYVPAGQSLLETGETNSWLYLIRKGALEVFDSGGNLHNRFSAGNWLGYKSLLKGGEVTMSVKVIEDALLYMIPGDLFLDLVSRHGFIKKHFSKAKPERLRQAIRSILDGESNRLVSTHVRDLVHGLPLMAASTISILEAAQLMSEKKATAILIVERGDLKGIVTDRAFCTKVAALACDLDLPVSEIMTPTPLTINADRLGSDALLMMARHNIRHLPVVEGAGIIGMVTATDIIYRQSHNAIYLVNEIFRASTLAELVQLSKELPNSLVALVANSLTAYDTAHAMSSIGEAFARRLIALAMDELGKAPVRFAWVAAGSLARFEQSVQSDQDNVLILDDGFDEAMHGDYFAKLTRMVCDGLDKCGYVYCPGDVMASNERWRQPLRTWKKYFKGWIDSPEPRALMYLSVFFDLRCIYGEDTLLDELQRDVREWLNGNSIFLTHMAANALHSRPPLGFFRNFVLERSGREEPALDMKRRGVTPIVDIARVYALSAGLSELNTYDRLMAAARAGALSQSGLEDLRDAYEFISTTRLQHQRRQIELGATPDNFVPPGELSALERRHLKDAFDVVRTLQAALEQRYQASRLP